MTVRDSRRAPFCWQSIAALKMLRAEWSTKRPSLSMGLNVYRALTEVANDSRARAAAGPESEGFEAARTELAFRGGGISPDSVDLALAEIERIGLVKVERRQAGGVNLPSLYVLVEPEDVESRGSRLSRPLPDPVGDGGQHSRPGVADPVGGVDREEERKEVEEPPQPPRGGSALQRAKAGSGRKRDLAALAAEESRQIESMLAAAELTTEAEAGWTAITDRMREHMGAAGYDLWFGKSRLVGDVAGSLVVLIAPEQHAWIERRYEPMLNELTSSLTDFGSISFVRVEAEQLELAA